MNWHPQALAAGIAIAAAAIAPAPGHPAVAVPDDFVSETLVDGLDLPNGMAFLPDGRLLFTELKSGRVRMLVNGRLATAPTLTVAGLTTSGLERGLQGIAVDPGWPERPYVYLYYTHTGNRCVVVRYTGQGDLSDPGGENLVFDGRLVLIGDIPDADPNHQGGGLRFGPDGHLFVSVGEDESYCRAADSTSLLGQLLRLDVSRLPAIAEDPDAAVPRSLITPADNPLSTADTNARLVFAYGLRNPWRFHIDPVTGLVYLSDVGEADFEEIDEVRPGDYLGWPFREANLSIPRPSCPEADQEAIAYTPPILVMPHNPFNTAILSAGPYRPRAGAAGNWSSAYWGDVFYAEYYSGVLRRLEKTTSGWTAAPPVSGQPDFVNWATGLFGAVDFLVGPDGSLWWMRQADDEESIHSTSGSIGRIRFFNVDTTDTATEIQLVHAFADPERVRLEWHVADSGLSITLERRAPLGIWQPIAELRTDGSGRLTYEDRDVAPGAVYEYRLAAREDGATHYWAETRIEVPSRLELAVRGVRPQPGGESILIAFSLPAGGRVRIEMLDVAGRRVHERDLGVLDAGNQLVRLSGLGLASGFYVARVTQGDRSATGKAILTR